MSAIQNRSFSGYAWSIIVLQYGEYIFIWKLVLIIFSSWWMDHVHLWVENTI